MSATTIGIDIGGTKMLGVALDAEGTVQHEARARSPVHDLDAFVARAVDLIRELDAPGAAIGVGIAGLVDREGRLRYGPNLPTLREAPVRDALVAATGERVVVDNDANVAAIGEATYGAARGARDVLLVTLGTGIGGGLVLDGDVYRGAAGFAGEIGHFTIDRSGPMCACGERGHWEAIASGTALGRMARAVVERGGGAAMVAAAGGDADAVTGVHAARAAAEGDGDARKLLEEFADNVALGLAALANILDPECIVIAGGLVEIGALLIRPVTDAFARHVEGVQHRPPMRIVPAQLGERAGAIGAAILARSLV